MEAAIDRDVITPLENFIGKLPGGSSPLGRSAIGAVLGGVIVFGLKPKIMFKDGKPLPWSWTDPGDPLSTPFPWWMGVILPAVILGVFL